MPAIINADATPAPILEIAVSTESASVVELAINDIPFTEVLVGDDYRSRPLVPSALCPYQISLAILVPVLKIA
mgnify:CR=1 FL=1